MSPARARPTAYIGTVPGHGHLIVDGEGALAFYPCGHPTVCKQTGLQATVDRAERLIEFALENNYMFGAAPRAWIRNANAFLSSLSSESSICDEALEEASSILLSVKIQIEKRKTTVVERELLAAIEAWHQVHPVPTGVT